MGLSTALMAAPSVFKLGSNLLGLNKGRKSDAEKRINSMTNMLGEEISKPLTETTGFKTGKGMLDTRDRKNRKAVNNNAAVSGATDESKVANMSASNDSYNEGLQSLLSFADRLRRRNRSRYLNLLGTGENMRQNRIAGAQQNLNNVLNPLGNAGKALYMADMLSGGADDEALNKVAGKGVV